MSVPSPTVTEIVVSPLLKAVTKPVWLTDATAGSLDCHLVNSMSPLLVALSCNVSLTSIDLELMFNETDKTVVSPTAVTDNLHLSENLPKEAIISVSPGPKTLIVALVPLEVTVATDSTVELQLTFKEVVIGIVDT